MEDSLMLRNASDYYMGYVPKSEQAVIWRFMDFTKFLSILDRRCLFFPRSDKLGDPFEGSAPFKNWKKLGKTEKHGGVEFFAHGVNEIEHRKKSREDLYVSCWCMKKYESAAMWGLYTQVNQGVAIKSTVEHLHKSLPSKYLGDCLFLGVVNYINFNEEAMREEDVVTNRLFYKRKSFEHEAEMRAILIASPGGPFSPNENGLDILVDLETLIDQIYVGPGSPDWFLDLVKSTSLKFGIKKEIIRTSLDDDALF
jgi:hypothetical protein